MWQNPPHAAPQATGQEQTARPAQNPPQAQADQVPYPDGYRAWRHVKSELVEPGHPTLAAIVGLHHIYANERAMDGYTTGAFADGSVIVFDLIDVASANKVTTERARKSLWVMHKDMRRFAAMGGWGFELFDGDSRTERRLGTPAAAAKSCYGCHAKAPSDNGVFSRYRP